MIEQYHLSERRACRLVGLTRDAYRNPPVACLFNRELSGRKPPLNWHRCGAASATGGSTICCGRRIRGSITSACIACTPRPSSRWRKRRKAKRPSGERQPLQAARRINEVLSVRISWPNSLSQRPATEPATGRR